MQIHDLGLRALAAMLQRSEADDSEKCNRPIESSYAAHPLHIQMFSLAVQRQYEEMPYPRWIKPDR